jgi:ornithine cyclodeaminase
MSLAALPFLDAAAVDRALPMPRAIALMRDAFRALSRGDALVPVRHSVPLADADARMLVMPSGRAGARVACVKVVTVCPANAGRALPTIQGLLMAFDAVTGTPLALVDAERVTALRTGAASGLATQAAGAGGATTLALFGVGVQGAAQLEALACVAPLARVLVFARETARVEAFCDAWSRRLGIAVVPGTRAALREAEVVCTATTATAPLFSLDELHPLAHVNAVGSYTHAGCELPPALLASADVVVDQRSACLAEAGEFAHARETGHWTDASHADELGERVDNPPVPRTRRSVFKSVGNAVQDLACVEALLG